MRGDDFYARWGRFFSTEDRTQPQVLLQVEGLGAGRAIQAQLCQPGVDFLLDESLSGQPDQGATQVLAAVRVQVPQEGAEPEHVADVLAFAGAGEDAYDRRGHLRSREEDGRRQTA